MYRFFDRVNNAKAYNQLLADPRDYMKIAAFGTQPNEKPFIAVNAEQFALYVCADYVESQRIHRAMQAISSGKVVYVPSKEDVLLYKRNASKNLVYSRNLALQQILHGADAAVVCVEALMQFFPHRNQFFADCFTLKKSVCYDTKMLVRKLVHNGFVRVDSISGEGEFTMRGDILDISLPFGQRFRIDFFDDEVECIKQVNDEGVATDEVMSVEVYPLYDTCGMSVEKLADVNKYIRRTKLSPNAQARLAEIVSELSVQGGDRVDNGWLAPFCAHSPLWDYLPVDCVVFWDEPRELTTRVNFLYREHVERVANLTKAGEVLPLHDKALREKDDVFQNDFPQITLQVLPYAIEWFTPQVVRNFKTGAVPNYSKGVDNLATDIRNWKNTGYETVILAGTDGVKPTQDALSAVGCYVAEADRLAPNQADGLILPIGLEHGFVSHTNKLAIIGTRDLGRGLNQQSLHKAKKQAFLSVEKGDYVVHDIHGIGLCEGIQKITSPSGEQKDYVVVLYKNGDRLYVPVDATNMLSRYSGGENPTLSRLGGEDFAKVKNKVKSGIREMSVNLLQLYAEREKSRGFRYNIDEYLEEEFNQYFPYKAT
ncbi:MAG: hypothetical protein K2M64_03360, partial [Clostridia bacterium]|nr:hypothetical protein [Clostridia bacterium]